MADVVKTEMVVPLIPDTDASQQLVYGIVLSPDVLDSQGDIASADVIEKAAHSYLVQSRKSDVQHAEVLKGFGGKPIADIVESYIAPQDMTVAGQPVLKGAWVMGMRINDPDVWDRVLKGELTGFSIGGTAERV